MKQLLKLSVASFLIAGALAVQASTLSDVQSKGYVSCGVSKGLAGFSAADSSGTWTGVDVDVCRAVAAATLGDATKVQFVPLTAKERFTALQSGEIDMLSRNTTWTITRDASLGLNFAGVNYYDGQGFMVKSSLGVSSAYCIQNNRISHIYHKQELPNYGVFDEKRYFSSGNQSYVFECQKTNIGVLICEDQWIDDPISKLCQLDVDIVISLNASPFQADKHKDRLNICKNYASEFEVSYIYVNMVGGQDEVVFDGNSFVLDSKGSLVQQLPEFKEYSCLHTDSMQNFDPVMLEESIYSALVLATRDYIQKNSFDGALIGLSGGIDSALTLAIAVDAIGSENVHAVMMPYQFTSTMSLEDSELQALSQGVVFSSIDIHPMVEAFNLSLKDLFEDSYRDITEENIQARVRGVLLMALSNKHHKIVLATGNKSEMAVGYATLYGDMCGGFAPLKDISKTMVYQLANYRNTLSRVIPDRVITRPPSAELSPNQLDQDSLPPYDILDDILIRFVEMKQSVYQISEQGHDLELVNKITSMILNNEYKRRQSAPGPKISSNAFGRERRYPMTSKFKP